MEPPDLPPSTAAGIERPVWRKVHGLWRPLYGDFVERGVSVEWHDFRVARPFPWSQSFHDESLEICLNYTGAAELIDRGESRELGSEQMAFYTSRDQQPAARRHASSMHRFLTIELSAEYLRGQFAAVMGALRPSVRKFLENPQRFVPSLEVGPLPALMLGTRLSLLEPPVSAAAREAWYQSKILEVLAQVLFREDSSEELFCDRHLRVNRDRVARVQYLLERDIENPPSLAMLAREVECSPFYLSRLFTEEVGISIPKFLRVRRIEKAAALLSAEGASVTDAAMAVGYSSLSAFQKAFAERFGATPGQYAARGG